MTAPSRLIGTLLPRDAADLEAALDDLEPARRCDLVELRLDALPEAAERVPDWIGASPVPVVATCRRAAEGGRIPRTESERLDLLARAADCGARWIDVEHDVPPALIPTGARVLRSAHLGRLPEDLDAFVGRLLAAPADAGKLIVATATGDEVRMLLRAVRASAGRLVAHVLDRPSSRALSLTAGAPFTYGLLRRRGGFGFPLPLAERLRDQGAGRIGAGTRPFLLLGGAVEGSVSPHMLRRAFEARRLDGVALPWSCDELGPALGLLEDLGGLGAAVTIPFKGEALDLVRRDGVVHPCASGVGAANTLLLRDGRWHAFNTDRDGLADALLEGVAPDRFAGATALVLGAGGAARAAVRCASALGARPLVWARREEAARALVDALGEGEVVPELAEAVVRAPRLVIDATPAGPPGGRPLLDPERLPAEAVVLDMLVHARPTALAAAARAAGREVREGLSMLAFQAARQLHHLALTGVEGARLRDVGRAELERRDRGVLLIGLRGAGKSTLGPLVAERLELPYVDVDERIVAKTGRSPDAFLAAGEERAFRAAEAAELERLASEPAAVVATGGGAVQHDAAIRGLVSRSLTVWLDAPDDALLERLAAAPRAPLTDASPADEVARLRASRDAAYAGLADLRLDTSVSDPERLVDLIVDRF